MTLSYFHLPVCVLDRHPHQEGNVGAPLKTVPEVLIDKNSEGKCNKTVYKLIFAELVLFR